MRDQIFFTVDPFRAQCKYTMLRTYQRRGRPQQYCVYDAQGRIVIITTCKLIALRYAQSVDATSSVPSVRT